LGSGKQVGFDLDQHRAPNPGHIQYRMNTPQPPTALARQDHPAESSNVQSLLDIVAPGTYVLER